MMKTPPAIPIPERPTQNGWRPWEYLGWLLAFGVGYKFVAACGVPVPTCPMRAYTGLPCPFCGGTRSISAVLSLDLSNAVAFNPLVFVGLVMFFLLLVGGLIQPIRVNAIVNGLVARLRERRWRIVLLLLLAFNWGYLILFGPA